MNPVQRYFSPSLFTSLAYHMFNFLFGWHDSNWDPKYKTSYFRFTPRPTSAKAIMHWAQAARRGVLGRFIEGESHSEQGGGERKREGEDKYDITCLRCPVALFYGSRDEIIDGDKLVRECHASKAAAQKSGNADSDWKGVNLVYAEHMDGYEHMDVIWARDAPRRVFAKIVKIVERCG
ncbi:hypothetical protein HK102_013463 [Quaeritorhiza haematococci]|nr:hypothetical protein HK102_013463 [Quaeritorhiza haematococci]